MRGRVMVERSWHWTLAPHVADLNSSSRSNLLPSPPPNPTHTLPSRPFFRLRVLRSTSSLSDEPISRGHVCTRYSIPDSAKAQNPSLVRQPFSF